MPLNGWNMQQKPSFFLERCGRELEKHIPMGFCWTQQLLAVRSVRVVVILRNHGQIESDWMPETQIWARFFCIRDRFHSMAATELVLPRARASASYFANVSLMYLYRYTVSSQYLFWMFFGKAFPSQDQGTYPWNSTHPPIRGCFGLIFSPKSQALVRFSPSRSASFPKISMFQEIGGSWLACPTGSTHPTGSAGPCRTWSLTRSYLVSDDASWLKSQTVSAGKILNQPSRFLFQTQLWMTTNPLAKAPGYPLW